MKRKIVYGAVMTAAVLAAFFVGKCSSSDRIPLESIGGWETWETPEEVGIELQTDFGTWEITKIPYTAHSVTVTRTE